MSLWLINQPPQRTPLTKKGVKKAKSPQFLQKITLPFQPFLALSNCARVVRLATCGWVVEDVLAPRHKVGPNRQLQVGAHKATEIGVNNPSETHLFSAIDRG